MNLAGYLRLIEQTSSIQFLRNETTDNMIEYKSVIATNGWSNWKQCINTVQTIKDGKIEISKQVVKFKKDQNVSLVHFSKLKLPPFYCQSTSFKFRLSQAA